MHRPPFWSRVQLAWASLSLLTGLALLVPSAVQAQTQQQRPVTRDQVMAALAPTEQLARKLMDQTGVPGVSIGVVFGDETIYLKGLGVREAGTDDAVDADTVFQLASVSKPIASTIVAGVIGDGKATWDDPIVMHDPGFQMMNSQVTRDVTLRDMFAHRSGLPDHIGDLLEDLGFSRDATLHNLRYVPTENSFRAAYAYTNFGLTEAGVAAAKATGQSWEDLAESRLFQPLGMTRTSPRYADFVAVGNHALGHVKIDNAWVAKYQRDPDTESPAGGVSSSARDLSQWMHLQLDDGMFNGQQVIDADALAETHRPQMVSTPPRNAATDRASFYGLGWGVGYNELGAVQLSHSGAFNLGAATTVYLLPADRLGVVVLTNAQPIGVAEAIALSFLDYVRYGKPRMDWFATVAPFFEQMNQPPYGTHVDYTKVPDNAAPGAPPDAYVGTYANDFFGQIQVVNTGGGLAVKLGPKPDTFPMSHYSGNVFSYQPTGENAYGLSGVTFTVGAMGRATTVTIENLNIHDLGTFTRVEPAGS
jgi:CubicO group peptidase (beta-lactamase class C family)